MSVPDLADLMLWLPPGCPLWIAVGGPMAWSAEERLLNAVEFRLRVLDWRKTRGTKPKPNSPPPYAVEGAVRERTDERKMKAYLRRQRRSKPD